MDTPTDRTREMLTIMENLSSLHGGNFNPEAAARMDMEPLAMPPHLEATNRAAAAASAARPMSLNKLSTKPKRPLSAYNIFFKHEREKLVSDAPDDETPVTLESLKVDPTRKPNKRRHRKSHGKIGFADLARTIAEKWKSLDAEQRTVYEACAAKEKERYQKEITEWKEMKKSQSLAQDAAIKNQAALDHADFLYNSSRSTMQEGFSSRDFAGLRSLDSSYGDRSSRTMTDGPSIRNSQQASLQSESLSAGGVQDPRDYLKITQQVIDMARASLSLPLFANLGRTGILDDYTARYLLGDQESSLRMNDSSQPSSFLRSDDMESSQLSNGALLNVPFGNDPMSSLDSESLYQNQLMQSLDSNRQGYFNNQRSSIREELESRAFMNQYRQSEWDSANQDYPDYGSQSTQDQLLQSLQNQTSRQANQNGLLSSLRNQASREAEEHDELLRSLRNQVSRRADEGSLLSNLRNQVSRQAEEQDSILSSLRNQASRPADGEELLNRYNLAARQPDGDELVYMINAALKDHF